MSQVDDHIARPPPTLPEGVAAPAGEASSRIGNGAYGPHPPVNPKVLAALLHHRFGALLDCFETIARAFVAEFGTARPPAIGLELARFHAVLRSNQCEHRVSGVTRLDRAEDPVPVARRFDMRQVGTQGSRGRFTEAVICSHASCSKRSINRLVPSGSNPRSVLPLGVASGCRMATRCHKQHGAIRAGAPSPATPIRARACMPHTTAAERFDSSIWYATRSQAHVIPDTT